jgi:hypothetical protein
MTTTFEPVFDHARTYPVVGAADGALRASNWPAVQAAYSGASSPYERHLIVAVAQEVDGCEGFLSSVVEHDPADLLAATMLAWREVLIGWDARGAGRASTVDASMWEAFQHHLTRAELLLTQVCAREPGFEPAWGVRLVSARGLELGLSELQRRYERLTRASKNDLLGQSRYLQALLPKWFGTWELAHQFAWSCATDAPPGAPNASVVVEYHVERWLDANRPTREVFADPQVRHEISSAAEASVLNPAFSGSPGWVHALSQFALAFSLMEDWPRARYCFTRLGPFATRTGWSYFNENPAKVFVEQREKAMSQG